MSSGDASWPVALFGERVGLKLVIAACDALLASVTIDDTLWTSLRAIFNEEAILEIVMPCGFLPDGERPKRSRRAFRRRSAGYCFAPASERIGVMLRLCSAAGLGEKPTRFAA